MSGLYVRSNVAALTSANYLNRNLADLSNIMTRLSTGLRINSGKDDPAGLIASELLKSDMTATTKAITNVQRANSMVAIADAALGQISSLLNDIRGLVNESANTSTMTPEMISANQLQVDAALDSIDRIAKTTNYLGKLLLDGSNDFQTLGLNRSAVKDLKIHEANFGTGTEVGIGINVVQDATHAQLIYDKAGVSQDTVIEVGGNDGSSLVNIAGGSTVVEIAAAINLVSDSTGVRAVVGNEATAGQIFLTSAGLDNDINITALVTGANAGNYTFKFTAGDSDKTTYSITEPQNGRPGIIEFKLQMQPHAAPSATKLDESFNGIFTYDISGDALPTGTDIVVQTNNGQRINSIEYVQFTADNPSTPPVAATFNKATGKLQIHYDASGVNVTEDALRKAINAIDGFEYKGIYSGGTPVSPTPPVDKYVYEPPLRPQIGTGIHLELPTPSPSIGSITTNDWAGKTIEIVAGSAGTTTTTVAIAGSAITITAASTDGTNIDATYDEILAALNGSWTGKPAAPAGSLKLTDASGNPLAATVTGAAAAALSPVSTGTQLYTTTQISGTDAELALWLGANGTGTKDSIDLRANNALDIVAAVPGTKFENTDVVYVKAEGDVFSEMFKVGTQNVYLSSDDIGAKGVTFNFVSGGTAGTVTATLSGDVLNVVIGEGATLQQILGEINLPTGTGTDTLPADWGTFSLVNPTDALINLTAVGSAEALIGKSLGIGNVQLDYRDTPTPAAATITLNGGAIQMRIVADSVGTCLNDVMIEFEQDDSFKAGDVSAVYDAERKILHIRGQIDNTTDPSLNATYGSLKAAIEANSPFHVDITTTADGKAYALSKQLHTGLATDDVNTGLTLNSPLGSGTVIKTGQIVGDVGGNHQTLYITVSETATANDVVKAFNEAKGTTAQIAANFIVTRAVDNTGTGLIFDPRFDADIQVRVFTSALTGGNSGLESNVTAKELVNFINNDAVLSKLFMADVARGQVGNGFLTLFDEAAYYGSTVDDNALQFLGPKDSPDVLFVIDGPNSELGISFVDNYGTGCVSDSRPVATLNATNINAAFLVQALSGGSEYDDMVVRMIRLDNNHSAADSYATYKSGPSNAMAYCSIDSSADNTSTEQGKFIIYANQQGDRYNNVDVLVRLDADQTAPATAYFDEATKKLIVTVNSVDTTLSEAVAAINNEGTFQAEYDYSFNNRNESLSDGPGLATFSGLFGTGAGTGVREATVGNTGNTGGHKGGVLEVYVGGTDTEITAQAVINTINNGPTVKSLFMASAIGGVGAGTGIIDFRGDNIQRVLGSDGKMHNEVNMVTGILGSDSSSPGYMIIHLATDANGNSITTANDLVKFFDMLTPEQTRGISVSVVRPPGVDNLDRVWTVDSCGNLIEHQLCDNLYGFGILQPTYEIDDCYNYTYFPIEFFSYGEDKQPGNAYGSVIAQNGKDASLDIRAKVQGIDFNGVGFKYVKLGDPMAAMYAEYDAYNKMMTVFIQEGATAAQVKNVIETSAQTKNLFEVSLPGNGSGVVSLQDDYLLLKGGIYDAGYRGGAAMLGAADADPNKLTLESIGEGSRQYVSVRWLDGGMFNVKDVNGNTRDTSYGTDMIATINGMKAAANGRELSLSSAMLKMNVILDGRVTTGDSINFTITGGGSLVQMGPDVVSNQQVRFGLPSVSSAHLGGGSGRLYQLRTGGVADLETSDGSRRLADRIVQEAIMSVSQLRGRLGAIQRNTLEPQINALQDSLVAMSSAEAMISNADFAEESSLLTRAQILVQAGTRALSIANQFPQYAAALLGG